MANIMTLSGSNTPLFVIMLVVWIARVCYVDSFSFQNPRVVAPWRESSLRAALGKHTPGSELFPGKGPYIPSGLSEEQYQKIKRREEEKIKSMNFGAFGPRFKPSETPDGDWFLMRSLWTNGVNKEARPKQAGIAASDNPSYGVSLARLREFLALTVPGFILGYIFIDMAITAVAMWKATELTLRKAVLMILKLAVLKRKEVVFSAMLKTRLVKITFASALIPFTRNFLETMNRQKLWTKRRTILVSTAVSMACLTLWACALRLYSLI